MPALTKTQIDHARTRLSEQKEAHVARRLKLIGERPEVPGYTDAQKTEMIRSGAAKLNPEYDASSTVYHRPLGVFFDFPQTPEMQTAQRAADAWDETARLIREEATRIEQSVLDELIMSPDGKAALDRIAAAFA